MCGRFVSPEEAAIERAPVVLPESAHAGWLDRALIDAAKVKAIADAHAKPEEFTHYRVRPLMNDARLDGPELIEPVLDPAQTTPLRMR
jgi:putative SOS response-associated peptidase YedK